MDSIFTVSKLIEINTVDLFEGAGSKNKTFCRKNYRAVAKDDTMYLMDGTNYTEMLDKAIEFGCTDAFLAAYKQAIDFGADLVLFYE